MVSPSDILEVILISCIFEPIYRILDDSGNDKYQLVYLVGNHPILIETFRPNTHPSHLRGLLLRLLTQLASQIRIVLYKKDARELSYIRSPLLISIVHQAWKAVTALEQSKVFVPGRY